MAIIFLRPRTLVCAPKYSGMISAISSSVRPMRLSQSILAMRASASSSYWRWPPPSRRETSSPRPS